MSNTVLLAVTDVVGSVDSIQMGMWFFLAIVLIIFMQCSFAMVETGFTRAKNAGNIIMKNLVNFCIVTVTFIFLGFSLMMSETYILQSA